MAAGLWPEPTGEPAPQTDASRVVRALRAACSAAGGAAGAGDAVRGVYEGLLSSRPPALAFGPGGGGGGGKGGGGGDDGGGALRGALLRSLAQLCEISISEELEQGPRGQVGSGGVGIGCCVRGH